MLGIVEEGEVSENQVVTTRKHSKLILTLHNHYGLGLAKGSKSEHPLPNCQGSHDVSWLHSDREKDCGLKIPLSSTAKFQLERSSPLSHVRLRTHVQNYYLI